MFEPVKPLAMKINGLIHQLPLIEATRKSIEDKKQLFLTDIKKEHVILGVLCILALIFDFGLSTQTLKPLAKIPKIQPWILALLFNLIDAFIAILASGILAKTLAEVFSQRKIWRPVLWALCIIKLAQFWIFSTITVGGRTGSFNSKLGTILIVCLSILVYVILDLAGGGLYFLVGKIKYYILLEIWHPKSHEIQKKLAVAKNELEQKCNSYNYPFDDVKRFFNLNF